MPRLKEQLSNFSDLEHRGKKDSDSVLDLIVSSGTSWSCQNPAILAGSATGMPISDEERFKLEYKKLDDDIRHYSTTRSALTSFLMTVGLTLLAYSFSNSYPNRPSFLWITGLLILAAAVYVCLEFSRRTERSLIHQKELWDWSQTMAPPYPSRSDILKKVGRHAVCARMIRDRMNAGLIVALILIVVIFFVCKYCVCRHRPKSGTADSAAAWMAIPGLTDRSFAPNARDTFHPVH